MFAVCVCNKMRFQHVFATRCVFSMCLQQDVFSNQPAQPALPSPTRPAQPNPTQPAQLAPASPAQPAQPNYPGQPSQTSQPSLPSPKPSPKPTPAQPEHSTPSQSEQLQRWKMQQFSVGLNPWGLLVGLYFTCFLKPDNPAPTNKSWGLLVRLYFVWFLTT